MTTSDAETEEAQESERDVIDVADDADAAIAINDTMEIRRVDVQDLWEQDINPNVMEDEMFQQLVENIRERGALESMPYVWENDEEGHIEIISGHHRTRAADEAGLDEIWCIVETGELSEDAVKAKQLAHNSISGEQDDQLVKRLYDDIESVDRRIEAYIDEEDLDVPTEDYSVERVDADMERHTVNMMFLPRQLEQFEDTIDSLSRDTERVYIADVDEWEEFSETVNEIRDVEEIRSIAAVMSRMTEIVNENWEPDTDDDDDGNGGGS